MSAPAPEEKPRFFAGAAPFRAWLAKHHATRDGLLVGFHRVASGKGGLSYAEALDEALCVGWIDGQRRGLDESTWSIRFSRRRRGSIWSQVNIRHVARLEKEGRMRAAGRAAFEARDPAKTMRYSHEVRSHVLAAPFAARLAADARARAHFDSMPPSYRRAAVMWIMTAKQEATRERRFAALLDCSRRGMRVPPLDFPRSDPRSAAAKSARRVSASRKA